MKRLYLFILFISISFISTAQTDFRFADSTAQWNVLFKYPAYPYSGSNYDTKINVCGSDTTIGGNTYQHISHYYVRRENGKVLAYKDGVEYIIYDFTVSSGDTIQLQHVSNYVYDLYATIDSVGSVFIGNMRMVIYLTYHSDTISFSADPPSILFNEKSIWIDGIGEIFRYNEFGLPGCDPIPNEFYPYSPTQSLLCFFEDGQSVYHDSLYDTCFYKLTQTGISKIQPKVASIYPNPVTQSQFMVTLFELPKPNTTFMLYDAVGRLVRREELNSINQTIYTSGLANGMYTYVVEADKVKSGSGKLVVAK